MASVSEVARDMQRTHATAIPNSIPDEQQSKLIEQVTIMQGSIWQYSDSQPWFIVGLHKNNPTATREALETIMKLHIDDADVVVPRPNSREKRRGTVSLRDGRNNKEDQDMMLDSQQGKRIMVENNHHHNHHQDNNPNNKLMAMDDYIGEGLNRSAAVDAQVGTDGKGRLTSECVEDLYTGQQLFTGPPETKIVIKKTVELIGDMSKSCELVFHAVRACARFLTYPTPSVPSDNFVFGHMKGWIWLIYKGLSHFNHQVADKSCLDASMKTFRKEMSLLAKEANACVVDLYEYVGDLKKLNVGVRREALLLKKKIPSVCGSQMDKYFRFMDELRTKRHLLVNVSEDRFFPTDWLFEPHPSQTKLRWDFFHFQWVNVSRGWLDSEFEIRSDYSLHWKKFTAFSPEDQREIIVHLIQHVKALIEECHHFHKENLHLSFDTQEIKFLKFSLQEIAKLKRHRDAIVFIASITKKLFEDLSVLQKISEEYVTHMNWILTVIEPCYHTINSWVAEDLILPLEFRAARLEDEKTWLCCNSSNVCFFRRKKKFHEIFGDPLKVVLMRTPISIPQLEKFFPSSERIAEDVILPSADINVYGLSTDYKSSIFDAAIGREQPLPLTHPLPKYKKNKKRKQTFNIFDIQRLIDATTNCIVVDTTSTNNSKIAKTPSNDVDTEKYLLLVEEVQRFLAVFATIFTYITADLKERVETLESLMYSNLPEHYETLNTIITYEKLRQWDNIEKSGTRVIGRLHRIFQFVVFFLEKVNGLEDSDTTFYAAKYAYYRSYGKTQSWIYQKAAVFSMYSLPHKVDMFNSLFTEAEKPSSSKNIKSFMDTAYRLIDVVEGVYKLNGVGLP